MEQGQGCDSITDMDPNARRVAVVVAIALIAATGGVALGNFAVSRSEPKRELVTGTDPLMDDSALTQAPVETPEDIAPKGYTCTGCDARLGNEAAVVDTFEPFDTPLPAPAAVPHAAATIERPDRRLDDIPVIKADRTAPDAVRRRARVPAGANGALAPPVLSAPLPEPGSPVL